MNKPLVITLTAAVAVGTAIGFAIPVHSAPVEDTYVSHALPAEDAGTNEDALFDMSIAGVVPPERTEIARQTVKDYCAAIDGGMTGREALDAILSPLTTSQEVVEASAAIGGGVQSYCPEHLGDMLGAAEAMSGQVTA